MHSERMGGWGGNQRGGTAAATTVPLEGGAAGRVVAGLMAAVLCCGGLGLLVAEALRGEAAPSLGRLAAAGGLVCLIGLGGAFVPLAAGRRGTLTITADALTVDIPALLRAPVTLPRFEVAAVAVDEIAAREPRARRPRTDGMPAPWWPNDLTSVLPTLHGAVPLGQGGPDVAVLLRAPRPLGRLRWTAWLRAHCTGKLLDLPPAPTTRAHGFLLRTADPAATSAALAGWAPRPVPDTERQDLKPLGLGAVRRMLVVATLSVMLLATLGAAGGPSGGGPPAGCAGLQALLDAGLRDDSTAVTDLPSSRPAGLEEVLPAADPPGLRRVASAALDQDAAAATRPDSGLADQWLGAHRFRRGWGQTLAGSADARVDVTVLEFSSARAALRFDESEQRDLCAHADESFALGAVGGSIGLRMRTDAGHVERISFLRGGRQYVVRVASSAPDAGIAAEVAEWVARGAR